MAKIVEVKWIDSCSNLGWSAQVRTDPGPMNCHSVGWLIHEDKETVTIASSKTSNSCHSPLTIPRVAILNVKIIRNKK